MKILLHDYAGHAFPVTLSRELARRGAEVVHAYASDLVTPRGALASAPDDPARLGFRAVPMAPEYREKKYSFLARRRLEREYGRELARVLEAEQPDIVISGNTPTEPQWMLLQAAQRRDVPVITWVQDFYSLAVSRLARKMRPVLGAAAGWWYRWLDARCFRASAGLVVITEDFVDILRRFGVRDHRIAVIPNWASLADLPVRPRHNAWSAAHGLDDKFVFLYSGTLGLKHNPELLVRLADRFANDPSVRVVVNSEGPGADMLRDCKRRWRRDNLLVLPYQPFGDLPDVHASADVLVAVLEADAGVFSVPSKVLSYHCASRPLLAAIPGRNLAARTIRAAGSGLVVEPEDRAMFISMAARLHASYALRATLGRNARAHAHQTFDIGAITSRFEDLVADVLADRGAGASTSPAAGQLETASQQA